MVATCRVSVVGGGKLIASIALGGIIVAVKWAAVQLLQSLGQPGAVRASGVSYGLVGYNAAGFGLNTLQLLVE